MTKVMVAIGQAIRLRRNAAGLSQRDLARAAGTTAAAISHIERGGRNPSSRLLVRIADALQCLTDDLVTASSVEDDGARHLRHVLAVLKGLPPPLQAEVADFCDFLKERASRRPA
jgi:transcriptional regulator with XRE-family HTH domain